MKKRTHVSESGSDFPQPILFPFPFFSFPIWAKHFFFFLFFARPLSILFSPPLSLCCLFTEKTKILSPQKLNAWLEVIKGRILQQEKKRKATFFSFYFFSLLFLAFKIQCHWVEISCVMLVVGVEPDVIDRNCSGSWLFSKFRLWLGYGWCPVLIQVLLFNPSSLAIMYRKF